MRHNSNYATFLPHNQGKGKDKRFQKFFSINRALKDIWSKLASKVITDRGSWCSVGLGADVNER